MIWRSGAIVIAGIVALPLLGVASSLFTSQGDLWRHLAATQLTDIFLNTLVLLTVVGLGTTVIGAGTAWLVTMCSFPGSRLLQWALLLPLVLPTYIIGYAYADLLAFAGPVQVALRRATGWGHGDYWFPDLGSASGVALLFTLVLYPYVYAACRAFFVMQSGSMAAAARTLGAGGYRAFFSVTLPLSRPALVVGITLAMMEVVNDLGAVQYFGVNSLTAVIYSTWINRSNFGGAAQLAVTIVLIIAVLILAEQWARRDRVYMLHRDTRVAPPREQLVGAEGWAAAGFCTTLLLLGFGVPFGELAVLALRNLGPDATGLTLGAGLTTVMLAGLGALVTVAIGLLAARVGNRPRAAGIIKVAALGYAIPGTVLALGLLQPLGQADLWFNRLTMALADWRPGLILSGSIAALIYVYAIRFLAVSHSTIDAAMKKRGDTMLDAGRVLGVTGWRLLLRVDLPTLSPALLTAATLVFVEIVKELPATLLLRPLGVETLATVVYARANVSLFTEAALPALTIVLVGLVPVILSTRFSDRR